MKKTFKIAIAAVAVCIVLFVALKVIFGEEKTTIQVETSKIQLGTITTAITATGRVNPVDTVEVGTQVSGQVKKIYVTYNTMVKEGQLIAELDKTNLNESVSNAKASYDAAINQLRYYRQNYDRQKNMYEAGVISKADYEQALYELKNAESNVSQTKTVLVQAQTNLSYANIFAPIDGIVMNKYIEEGQTVAASMTTPTLFTIARDINQMQVEADVDEADIGDVKEGLRVSFTVDAFPEEVFSGKVKQVRLGAKTTSNVVTYTVIIDADNPDKKLKPGLTATVSIFTSELSDVPTVEAQALNFIPDSLLLMKYYQQNQLNKPISEMKLSENGKKYVWLKHVDGTLSQREVVVGKSDGLKVEITKGLSNNDEVVLQLEEHIGVQTDDATDQSSPFMPKRPSQNNKKSSQQ
ncbi:efflux RND transporter periplasmic adaptor subunit [Sphingobacterium sp. LRF_L2]|uniref:efflux RND transporter periplasmic adaptor subunit n=1 Tax=Sphingobacterium sp. LRF_L2 TaxID=3369421 RepID=UPI003F6486FE